MRPFKLALISLLVISSTALLRAMTEQDRRQYWDQFSKVIPPVPSFTAPLGG